MVFFIKKHLIFDKNLFYFLINVVQYYMFHVEHIKIYLFLRHLCILATND